MPRIWDIIRGKGKILEINKWEVGKNKGGQLFNMAHGQ